MIEMNFTESFIKQQVKCLDILSELIAYDKQHGDPPEKTRVLEGFCLKNIKRHWNLPKEKNA